MGAKGFEGVATETQEEKAKATTTIFADTMEGMCEGRPVVYYAYCGLLKSGLLEISSADLPTGAGSNSSDPSYPCTGPSPRDNNNSGRGSSKYHAFKAICETPIKIDLGLGSNPFSSAFPPHETTSESTTASPALNRLEEMELEERELKYILELSNEIEKIEEMLESSQLSSPKRKRLEARYAFMESKFQKITRGTGPEMPESPS